MTVLEYLMINSVYFIVILNMGTLRRKYTDDGEMPKILLLIQ